MSSSKIGIIGVPAAVVSIVVMLIIPMPTVLLDVLISSNITFTVVVLLTTMHVKRPLDFSAFPTLLLVATMFRLALNVSATRLILLHAYAGTVIESFGHFVVGGSLVVGLVVFLILIVIQFVVVTNGSGRVAEVAARFTLDAMPGKQMSIDADLNAGLIDEAEAKRRRQEISDEADFYGAMDGASKFVRGDAIAAVVIVAINLIGGFAIGVIEKHMSLSQAVHTYSLLSIGDGLVSQIPALLLSISTGIVVTRAAAEEEDFGTDLIGQFRNQHRALRVAGIVMALLAFLPGLPHLAFLVVGAIALIVGYRASRSLQNAQPPAPEPPPPPAIDAPEVLAGEMKLEAIELELAIDLIDLVDSARGGDLLERVKGLRRKVAVDKGFILPSVRTRDNVNLDPGTYLIKVHGVEVARGSAPPGRVLAIGDGLDYLPGEPTVEPVFGLSAKWVPVDLRQQAIVQGATVVDRSSVITTHLSEIINEYAASLLSIQQVRQLLDAAKQSDPAIVEEMAAIPVSLTELHKVLAGLLDEGVPIRDFVRIVEAVTNQARSSKDPELLLEAARSALGPAITARYSSNGILRVITMEATLEQRLLEAVRPTEQGSVLVLDAPHTEQLAREISTLAEQAEQRGFQPVLLCSPKLRPPLRRMLKVAVPRVAIMSVDEIGPQVRIERVGMVSDVDETAPV